MSFFSRIFGQKAVAQPEVLIFVQRDIGAPLGDRDDAAKDLAEFDEALPVLVETALRPGEDETLVDSCGESIAEIWQRTSGFDRATFDRPPLIAQSIIAGYFPGKACK
ncbi:MAG: hypothetical protein ACK57E_14085 [Erythrobacteraceae bacterium]